MGLFGRKLLDIFDIYRELNRWIPGETPLQTQFKCFKIVLLIECQGDFVSEALNH